MRIKQKLIGFCVAAAFPTLATAAVIEEMMGQVQPSTLRLGQRVEPGTNITTGPNSIVIIRYPHPTPDGIRCEELKIFGNGESHRVAPDNLTPRACPTQATPAPSGNLSFSQSIQASRPGPSDGAMTAAQRALVDEAARALAPFENWRRRVGFRESRDMRMMDLEIGVDYGGYDLGGPQMSRSAVACANLCAQNDSCRAVTFVLSTTECWLKSRAAPEERRSSENTISARKRPLGAAVARP
jgi:hypothetical protein